MKILYVSFEPINSGSSAATCSVMNILGLLELGHEIEILTINRSIYKEKLIKQEIVDNCVVTSISMEKETNNSADVIPSQNIEKKSSVKSKILEFCKSIYRKISIYNYSYFFLKEVNIQSLRSDYYDIIISSSDPVTSHKAVSILINQGLDYRKWIQHWGDPLAEDINKKSIWPRFVLKNVEKSLLKKADKVVYLSPFTVEMEKKQFEEYAHKMTYVIPASEFNHNFSANNNPVIKLAYCGIYDSHIRDIKPLYNAVTNSKNVSLKIAGNSDIQLESNENVTVFGYIPHSEAIVIESEADAIVCILNKMGTQIPAKLYYYAGTNKQIIVIYESGNEEIVKFLRKFNRFIFVENNEALFGEIFDYIRDKRLAESCNMLLPKNVAEKIIGDL